jgi:mannobiose 2-epimerase
MAEAVVALVHRHRLYGDGRSMAMAENLWRYIKACFISPYGEWHASVSEKGEPIKSPSGLCGAWKCPYHNGRMCIELMGMLP